MLVAAATADAAPETRISSFKLDESNGYKIEVASFRTGKKPPIAIVTARQRPASASYEVRASTGAGIHATFGALGQIDVSFQRDRKRVIRPERACRWVIETGTFRGGFRFAGEGSYVTSEAIDPEGEVLRLPDGFCGLRDFRPGLPPGLPRETVLTAETKTESGKVRFRASRSDRLGAALFNASTQEKVEGMNITRSNRGIGRQGTFTVTGTSRAAAAPSLPFSGSARFRDPRNGRATWVGTLAVSLPGLEGVALAGENFSARLCPHLSYFESCRPPGTRSRTASPTAAAPTPSPWRWPGSPR